MLDHAVDAGSVDLGLHQRPGRADGRRRDHDEAARARLAQPAPQEGAAIAAAAMQGHDQRIGTRGVVVFRHVEREGAARAGGAADMHHADSLAPRIDRGEAIGQRRVRARRAFEEELADRLQERRHGIERLRPPWRSCAAPGRPRRSAAAPRRRRAGRRCLRPPPRPPAPGIRAPASGVPASRARARRRVPRSRSSSRPAMASTSCGREVGERCRPANSRACSAFSVAGTSWATASMAGSVPGVGHRVVSPSAPRLRAPACRGSCRRPSRRSSARRR